MPQELEAEPFAFVRAFDDAGDVCDHERAAIRQRHDAKIGRERGERVIGDLGASSRDDGQERRLSGVRLAYEPDIGDELELELQQTLLPFLARLPFARRLVRGRGEVRIPLPAPPSAGNDDLISVQQHFAEQRAVALADDGAWRYGQNDVLTGAPR